MLVAMIGAQTELGWVQPRRRGGEGRRDAAGPPVRLQQHLITHRFVLHPDKLSQKQPPPPPPPPWPIGRRSWPASSNKAPPVLEGFGPVRVPDSPPPPDPSGRDRSGRRAAALCSSAQFCISQAVVEGRAGRELEESWRAPASFCSWHSQLVR